MTFDVIPVTDFRKQAKMFLGSLKNAPVVLTQRGCPTAVLLDYEAYKEREAQFEELELALDDLMLVRAVETAKEFISIEELFAE